MRSTPAKFSSRGSKSLAKMDIFGSFRSLVAVFIAWVAINFIVVEVVMVGSASGRNGDRSNRSSTGAVGSGLERLQAHPFEGVDEGFLLAALGDPLGAVGG